MQMRFLVPVGVLAVWLTCTGALANGYQGYIVSLDPVLQAKIQQALHDKGFDPGDIDGRYGPQTRKALLAFRAAHTNDPEEYSEILTPGLVKALFDIDLAGGANGEELSQQEQVEVLKKLGLSPTEDYWKGYVFPD